MGAYLSYFVYHETEYVVTRTTVEKVDESMKRVTGYESSRWHGSFHPAERSSDPTKNHHDELVFKTERTAEHYLVTVRVSGENGDARTFCRKFFSPPSGPWKNSTNPFSYIFPETNPIENAVFQAEIYSSNYGPGTVLKIPTWFCIFWSPP